MTRKIYLASSWRNEYFDEVLEELRQEGHEVFSFKSNEGRGFGFDPKFAEWDTGHFLNVGMLHPDAQEAFDNDFNAMKWANTGVLLLPCGRSAHLEAGWLIGTGRPTSVYIPPGTKNEPELMYKMFDHIFTSLESVKIWLKSKPARVA